MICFRDPSSLIDASWQSINKDLQVEQRSVAQMLKELFDVFASGCRAFYFAVAARGATCERHSSFAFARSRNSNALLVLGFDARKQ